MSPSEILDPDALLATADLALVAAHLVDGNLFGRNPSSATGDGSEFHSHRAYQLGDDLRRINWRMWARSDRLLIRESRAETNLPLYVLIDCSDSMRPANRGRSKWDYAARIAAAIALQATRAMDSPSLTIFSDDVRAHLPPRGGNRALADFLAELSRHSPEGATNTARALGKITPLLGRRGIVVLLSDLMDWSADMLPAISNLRHLGHDVSVVQVLDPFEIALPEDGSFVFHATEEPGQQRVLSAKSANEDYKRTVSEWLHSIDSSLKRDGVSFLCASTDRPLHSLFSEWMYTSHSLRTLRQ